MVNASSYLAAICIRSGVFAGVLPGYALRFCDARFAAHQQNSRIFASQLTAGRFVPPNLCVRTSAPPTTIGTENANDQGSVHKNP